MMSAGSATKRGTGKRPVTVILHPFFDNQLRSLHLQPLRGPSYAYGGIPIEGFDGFCRVRVELDGPVCMADVMISASEAEPIIGRDIINGLGLVIKGTPAGTANADSVPIAISPEVDKVHAPMPLPAQHPSPVPEVDSCSAILKEPPGLTLPKLGHYCNFQHRINLQHCAQRWKMQSRSSIDRRFGSLVKSLSGRSEWLGL